MTTAESLDPLSKENRDLLIRMLEQNRSFRVDESNLLWESIKYFTTLDTALITANVTLIGVFTQLKLKTIYPLFVLSLIIPVTIIILALAGQYDLSRRWSRLMETIATCSKLENALGLHSEITGRLTVFQKDRYLFPERYVKEGKGQSTDEFVEAQSKSDKRNMLSNMNIVYYLIVILGIAFIIIDAYAFVILPAFY